MPLARADTSPTGARRDAPVSASLGTIAPGPEIESVSAGHEHTCALTTAGGVRCWGANDDYQLGNSAAGTGSTTPVHVSGLTNGVAAISAGGAHTCALTTAGGVKCWGTNVRGQLGDGTNSPSYDPVDVSGLGSGVVAISAGGGHTCALTATGAAKCWGGNLGGPLGDGTETHRSTPVGVSGLDSGVTAISAGDYHTCAVQSGAAKCWGDNSGGQIGNGTYSTTDEPVLTPTSVVGLGSGVTSVSASQFKSCASTSSGVQCWGSSPNGDGTSDDHPAPVAVTGLSSVTSLSVGDAGQTCAVTSAGAAMCWGYNIWGEVGDGSTEARLAPVTVSGLSTGVASISAGGGHSCAVTTAAAVECWGYNSRGQVGDGTTTDRHAPVDVVWKTEDPVIKYAPRIFLHPKEEHWPMSIAKFIDKSTLKWTHNAGCDDDYAVASPRPSRLGGRLGDPYVHSSAQTDRCRERDDVWRTSDFTRPRTARDEWGGDRGGLEKSEGFVLNLKNSYRTGTRSKHADSSRYSGTSLYYQYDEANRWIRYFIMYGWSESAKVPGYGHTGQLCCHEGEWEGLSIKLDESGQPVEAFLNQHHWGMRIDWDDLTKVDGTHPVVYSARGAHATYPASGDWPVSGLTDVARAGKRWDTWDGPILDVKEQLWWGFGGGWGDILAANKIPTWIPSISGNNYVGPLGPSPYMKPSPWACGAETPCFPEGTLQWP